MKKNENPTGHPDSNVRPITVLVISFMVLVIWIWALNWAFTLYTGDSYFNWFVAYGAQISIATSFFALVWEDLAEREGLLSFHPGEFLASGLALAAVFIFVLNAHLAKSKTEGKPVRQDPITTIELSWDFWLRRAMLFLMGVAVIGWLVFAAPVYYLLTLVTGAPARQELRGTFLRFVVDPKALRLIEGTTYRYIRADKPAPEGFVDVSLVKHPFALTNALNAAVLFLADSFLF